VPYEGCNTDLFQFMANKAFTTLTHHLFSNDDFVAFSQKTSAPSLNRLTPHLISNNEYPQFLSNDDFRILFQMASLHIFSQTSSPTSVKRPLQLLSNGKCPHLISNDNPPCLSNDEYPRLLSNEDCRHFVPTDECLHLIQHLVSNDNRPNSLK
jgi:hypothetical protein